MDFRDFLDHSARQTLVYFKVRTILRMNNIIETFFCFKVTYIQHYVIKMGVIVMTSPLTSPLHKVVSGSAMRPINANFHRYHGVAIRYYDPCACDAVRQIETKPFLSDRPLLYLETRRILVGEAPLLPLPYCTVTRCLCRYVHYEDRRERDRRSPADFICALSFVGLECRAGRDRRGL